MTVRTLDPAAGGVQHELDFAPEADWEAWLASYSLEEYDEPHPDACLDCGALPGDAHEADCCFSWEDESDED